MKSKNLIILFHFLLTIKTIAQIGIGTNSPNNSSILDLSSTTKGLLMPRISLTSSTDTSTIPNPVNSLLIYNTATILDLTPGFYFWATNKWIRITSELEGSWKNNISNTFATSNNQDIYQFGKIGIGTSIINYPLSFGSSPIAFFLNDLWGRKIAFHSNNNGAENFYGFGRSDGALNIFAGAGAQQTPFAIFTTNHEFFLLGDNINTSFAVWSIPANNRLMTVRQAGNLVIKGFGTSRQSTWNTTSDIRSKKNIRSFKPGLNEIIKIEPKTFSYNGELDTTDDGIIHTGIIAQDLQKILPSSIIQAKDSKGEEYLQLKGTDQILYSLVNAIKEQQMQIILNSENLKMLENKVEKQQKEISD